MAFGIPETYRFMVPGDLGTTIPNPWIITDFSVSTFTNAEGNQVERTTIQYASYPHTLLLDADHDEVTLSGDGAGGLVVTIGTDSFTIFDFEDGRLIQGIGYDVPELRDAISAADTTAAQFLEGADAITFTNLIGLSFVFVPGGVEERYFLHAVTYGDGLMDDLSTGITARGTDGDDTLQGFDIRDADGMAYDDTLLGGAGDDSLYGFAGNDLLVGGPGGDVAYGGLGDDTYRIALGDGGDHLLGPVDDMRENPGEGADTIHFSGIAPEDLRGWGLSGGVVLGTVTEGAFQSTTFLNNQGTDFWDAFERITFDDGTEWTAAGGLILQSGDRVPFNIGTEGSETLIGGPGDNGLEGRGGDDLLIGGAGTDSLIGGDGNDTYRFAPGDGTDDPSGLLESAVEYASEGTDTIHYTGIAPEDLRGWGFNEGSLTFAVLQPDGSTRATTFSNTSQGDFWEAFERIVFDNGTEWTAQTGLHLIGLDSDQRSYGTAADDRIEGRGGEDLLIGLAGNDLLIGGAGLDTMEGGAGDDTYRIAPGEGGHVVLQGEETVQEQSDEGFDTIHLTGIAPEDLLGWGVNGGSISFGTIDAGGAVFATNFSTGAAHDFWEAFERILFDDGTEWTAATGLTLRSPDFMFRTDGTARADTILGHGGGEQINGLAGDDLLVGGGGADTIFGEDGFDTVDYSRETGGGTVDIDLVLGTMIDTFGDVDSVSSVERFIGTTGHDRFRGDAQDTTFVGGTGMDQIDGGDGIDTASYAYADGGVKVRLHKGDSRGADGIDSLVSIEAAIGSDHGDLLVGIASTQSLTGRGGDDVIRMLEGADATLDGGDGQDRIFGHDGDEMILGGDDNDRVKARDGEDTVDLGAGDDIGRLGSGDDIGLGLGGADRIFGGRGNDRVEGGAGDDWLTGGRNVDMVFGDAGNDSLRGGLGLDTLHGGAGDDNLYGSDDPTGDGQRDTFVFTALNNGRDRIKDFEDGVDVLDLRDFGFANFNAVLALADDAGTSNLRIDFTASDSVVIENFRLSEFDASDMILN